MSSVEERLNELIKALEDERAADAAAWALGEIGITSLPALEKAYKNTSDQNKKIFIIKAMRKIGRNSVPFLIKMLQQEKKYWVRIAIVRAFGRMGIHAEDAYLVLFRELKDKDTYYQQKIQWALKEMSRNSKKIALIISEYNDSLSKKEIESILERFPPRMSVVEAFERIRKKDVKQLNECFKTLYRYCDDDIIQILVELLNDEDIEMRLRATIAFRVLNKKAKKTISHLDRAMLLKINKEIKFEIAYTLLIIEGLYGTAMKELEWMRDNDKLDINQQWKFETQIIHHER